MTFGFAVTIDMLYRLTNNIKVYVLAFMSVAAGVTVYIMWRPDTIRVFSWLEFAGMRRPVDNIRTYTYPMHGSIPEWIVYSLPNGLWAFSYALIITHLWKGNSSPVRYFWFASIPILTLGYEFFQYTGFVPGVFCIEDLIFSIAGISLGIATVFFLTLKKLKL
jgi:hypothetical protein